MSPGKKSGSSGESVIEDTRIKDQSHLFTTETAAALPDTTAKVQWPKYVRLQRQRRILIKRLKVPAAVNHFSQAVDKATAVQIFKFLEHYPPETKKAREDRIAAAAAAAKADSLAPADVQAKRVLHYGIKDVTTLVESKKAVFVVIAHDVDPIEIVLWLPALCRSQGIPYVIVKGKAKLGKLVGLPTTSAIALTDVASGDKHLLSTLVDKAAKWLGSCDLHSTGGGELSAETIAKLRAQGKHE
jgi:large subunit ribosomal protein L7Ae